MQVASRRPSTFHSIAEMPRVLLEVGALSMIWPAVFARAKRGSGQPVIVLPGFLGADDSTLPLRRFLTAVGYPAQPWLLSRNNGHPELIERLGRRLYRLHKVYGKPISLIGQSLGGVFAHELARKFPDAVRSVITLGSPFAAKGSEDTNPMVARMFETMSGLTVEEMRELAGAEESVTPLSQPNTSIYSKSDGVVSWQACLAEPSDHSENIEILGSHTGMAMHPAVMHIIADRLIQDPANWRRYQPDGLCSASLGIRRVH